ncbi:phage portal protein [Halalkalibacter wakoensis JCM 9140]|uniref:Phage portal protein n=1 Tax=Halalkalibacter wakoensis JCM 9140 TaxID=1236970 RepID=W4Q6M9_9BACI|nr:phage portal protein [Halalkalibacter wakoensis JCM 9140]
MKFFSWFKNESEEKPQADFNKGWKTLVEWLGLDDKVGDALSDATYYTCLKILSETIGKLPLKMYQDTDKGVIKSDKQELYNLLKLRPNPYMTSAVFWATVEMNRNHHGNAYVWIRYNGVEPKDLWIMQSENVEHVIDDAGLFGEVNNLWYKYTDPKTNKIYVIPSDNVMHFKTSMTFDGIKGKPVRDILKETVNGNLHSQKFMTNLYKTGLTGKAVLEYTGELDDKSKKRLVKGFEEFSSGSKNAGKIIPVPLGMKLVHSILS